VFHDLRHTFGTLAVQAWPLTDVKAYMGHADVQTTMGYVHHVPRTAAADELTRVIEAAVSPTVSRNGEMDGHSAQLSEPVHAPESEQALTGGNF
jgi:Phage integrase family